MDPGNLNIKFTAMDSGFILLSWDSCFSFVPGGGGFMHSRPWRPKNEIPMNPNPCHALLWTRCGKAPISPSGRLPMIKVLLALLLPACRVKKPFPRDIGRASGSLDGLSARCQKRRWFPLFFSGPGGSASDRDSRRIPISPRLAILLLSWDGSTGAHLLAGSDPSPRRRYFSGYHR